MSRSVIERPNARGVSSQKELASRRDGRRPESNSGSKPRSRQRKRSGVFLLFLAPAVILVVGLMAFPVYQSAVLSFHAANTFSAANAKFIGFDNYANFFKDPLAGQIIANTFLRAFGGVIPSYILGAAAALALNRKIRAMGPLRVIVLLPFVISTPVTVAVWKILLDPQSGVPAALGLHIANLFSNEQLVWPTLLLINAWASFQFYTILLLASLQRIPPELYEAAEMDGAGRWHKFTGVTAPAMAGISAAICILHFMLSFQEFNVIFIATGGGPLNLTQTMATYAYQAAFTQYNVGYATAITFVSAVLMAAAIGVLVGVGYLVIRLKRFADRRKLEQMFNRPSSAPVTITPKKVVQRVPQTVRRRKRRNGATGRRGFPFLATIFALFSLLPILYLVSRSLDAKAPGVGVTSLLPQEWTLHNFVSVLTGSALWRQTITAPPLILNLLNSAIVVIAVSLLVLVVGSCAGFALARWKSPVSTIFTGVLLVAQMIPVIILVFPLYQLAAQFHMLNQYGQIIATTALFLPLAILFFRVYFAGASRDIEEAASIDGAGTVRTFVSVVLPNARTAIGAMLALCLIQTWNEFLFALTLVPDHAQQTFPPAISQFTVGYEYLSHTSSGGQAVYLLLPIFISLILLSLTVKQFTTAVAGGATKG
jgi:multiple sugar transport system permease protein